jgi:Coenzyme PQQ synthesis protein D (PqqD)
MTETITDDELRLRSADLHWREIDDEVVALEARGSTYVAANPAGTLLWRALAQGSTRERLADELVAAYGIDRERALADTDAFVSELASQGLLEG